MKINQIFNHVIRSTILLIFTWTFVGCSSDLPVLPSATLYPSITKDIDNYLYILGPGDEIEISVWGNPEASGSYTIRPDGMISNSLAGDVIAAGKTPTALAKDLEIILATYVRDPIVSVSVDSFIGPPSESIRIFGEAIRPQAISYKQNMTLFDVMIAVGGLTDFAAGNNAKLLRIIDNQYQTYGLKIDKLINDGDIEQNVDMLPGDIIIIPEAWF